MSRRTISGSRIVITGASSGIGRELARMLAKLGASLVLTARREERLQNLVQEIRSSGQQVAYVCGDITHATVHQQLVSTVVEEFGGLDILINNAGVGAIGEFPSADPERLRRILEVNFFAPAELTRKAIPLLQQGKRPMIVNMGSVLGHFAVPRKSEYVASKFALHGFNDALRAELRLRGIDVLLVSPSTTGSEFFESVLEGADTAPKAQAVSPVFVARHTVKAIQKGKREIILTPGGKMLVALDRLWPSLASRLFERFA